MLSVLLSKALHVIVIVTQGFTEKGNDAAVAFAQQPTAQRGAMRTATGATLASSLIEYDRKSPRQ